MIADVSSNVSESIGGIRHTISERSVRRTAWRVFLDSYLGLLLRAVFHRGVTVFAVSVEDCYFRMVQPPEQMAAQRFPTDYIVMGNKGEQTAQRWPCNVAQWLGGFAAEALGGRGT